MSRTANPAPTSMARLAVLGRSAILCLIAAAPVAIVAVALRAESGLLDRARQAERMLSLYEARWAALPSLDASSEDERPAPFIEGETLAVAGAELRRRAIAIVGAAEGRTVESELMQASSEIEGAELVRLRLAVTGTNGAIQAILFDLETMRPPVVLSAVTIQSPGPSRTAEAPDEEPLLTASLVLDGYWKAGAR